jgi:DNA-binding transcriptional ArsR family regulator
MPVCLAGFLQNANLRFKFSFVSLAGQGLREIKLAKHYTLWCNVVYMDQMSDVLTAISHPSRRAIIGKLAMGPTRFTDVAKPFDTTLNAVTKHLKLLERAGLIERKKQGREVFISFRGEPLRQVAGWLHEYERFWNERLDEFQQYFKDRRPKEKSNNKKRKKSHEEIHEDH